MSDHAARTGSDTTLIWDRPEPPGRPAPVPLTRENIVRSAVALADAEGLGSVSLRKVGASLAAGPMRLYGFLSSKQELLDLMVDLVYGEMASAGPLPGNWREALRTLALRTREAAQLHPWFVELLGGRPHQGPNALIHLEASMATLSVAAGIENIDLVLQATKTVNAYVIGALQSQASELREERESGMSKAEWQAATGPYLFRMLATGRFPTIANVVRDATHVSPDVAFDQGLDCVLDGIEKQFPYSGHSLIEYTGSSNDPSAR